MEFLDKLICGIKTFWLICIYGIEGAQKEADRQYEEKRQEWLSLMNRKDVLEKRFDKLNKLG